MTLKKYIIIFLGLIGAVILFHLAIVTKIVPYDIAWGGRLQNDTEMYVFETISIGINIFLILVLLMKGNYLTFRFQKRTINLILWIFFALFVLNTIGNIFAKTNFEKFFAVVTLLFAFLIWKIVRSKEPNGASERNSRQ